MPITRVLDDEQRRILVTLTRQLTAEEAIASIDWQVDHQACAYALLYDTLGPVAWPEPAEVTRTADHVRVVARRHGHRGPVAVVARGPALRTARQYAEIDADVGPVAFFLTRAAAEWLNTHAPPT